MSGEPEGFAEREKARKAEAKRAYEERMTGPIGLLPDGTLNLWVPGTPKPQPRIIKRPKR
jgi:hypothetical protein